MLDREWLRSLRSAARLERLRKDTARKDARALLKAENAHLALERRRLVRVDVDFRNAHDKKMWERWSLLHILFETEARCG